jgi:hypothetical protein
LLVVTSRATAAACAVAALAAGCRCGPRDVPDRPPRQAPERRTASPRPGSALELELVRRRDDAEPAGEGATLRRIADVRVSLAMHPDMTSQAVDSGTVTDVQRDVAGVAQTSRAWTYHFTGTWRRDAERRVLSLTPSTVSCTETFVLTAPGASAGVEDERDCTGEPGPLELVCVPGPLPADDAATSDAEARDAWVCGATRPAGHPGTALPWVFSDPS